MMKIFVILCVAVIAAVGLFPASSSADVRVNCRHDSDNLFRGDNIDVDLEHGSIIYTNKDNDETVEITEDYGLIVNGNAVRLRGEQKRLVRDYYDCFGDIVDNAKEIGIEGVRVGARSAVIGIKAVVAALEQIANDCDTDRAERKLERKLNREGDKLEAAAERLEKKADRLEHKAKRLEKLHEQLRHKVSDLDDLGWF